MIKPNKVSNGIAVLTVEFGKVTKLPEKRFVNYPDTWAYVRGNDGGRDAYIPLSEGYQVFAGLECPELLKKKLRPDMVSVGQEIFFFRNGGLNEAVFWGSTKFLDQAILKIAERPVRKYRVRSYTYLNGALTSGNQGVVVAEGTLAVVVAKAKRFSTKSMDIIFDYKWEVEVENKWVQCESAIRADGTVFFEPVLIKPHAIAPSAPQVPIGPVVEVVAEAPKPLGPVTEVIAVATPSQERAAELMNSIEGSPKAEVSDAEAAAFLASVVPNAGADNTGEFRKTTTRAERRHARRQAGLR